MGPNHCRRCPQQGTGPRGDNAGVPTSFPHFGHPDPSGGCGVTAAQASAARAAGTAGQAGSPAQPEPNPPAAPLPQTVVKQETQKRTLKLVEAVRSHKEKRAPRQLPYLRGQLSLPGLSPAKSHRAEGSEQLSRSVAGGRSAEAFSCPGEAANEHVSNQCDIYHALVQNSLLPPFPRDNAKRQQHLSVLRDGEVPRSCRGDGQEVTGLNPSPT